MLAPMLSERLGVLTAEPDQPGATPNQAAYDRTAAIAWGKRCATGEGRAGAAQDAWRGLFLFIPARLCKIGNLRLDGWAAVAPAGKKVPATVTAGT